MRAIFLALAISATGVGPGLAQTDPALLARENDLWAQQQLQNQRATALENQLNALDARMTTETRLRDLRDQADRPVAPERYVPKSTAVPTSSSGVFPSIPDDALAASNARVRAASQKSR